MSTDYRVVKLLEELVLSVRNIEIELGENRNTMGKIDCLIDLLYKKEAESKAKEVEPVPKVTERERRQAECQHDFGWTGLTRNCYNCGKAKFSLRMNS